MITIPITYHDPTGRGHSVPFWSKVLNHYYYEVDNSKTPNDMELAIFEELKQYRAHIRKGENGIFYLEFDDKEDMLLFVLRWA